MGQKKRQIKLIAGRDNIKKLLKILHDYRVEEGIDLKEMSIKLKTIAEHFEWRYNQDIENDIEESIKEE